MLHSSSVGFAANLTKVIFAETLVILGFRRTALTPAFRAFAAICFQIRIVKLRIVAH